MLTLNLFHTFSSGSIFDFEQVNVCWDNFLLADSKNTVLFSHYKAWTPNKNKTTRKSM